jgi:hypothetical protein
MVRILERIGQQVRALGVPDDAQLAAVSGSLTSGDVRFAMESSPSSHWRERQRQLHSRQTSHAVE